MYTNVLYACFNLRLTTTFQQKQDFILHYFLIDKNFDQLRYIKCTQKYHSQLLHTSIKQSILTYVTI